MRVAVGRLDLEHTAVHFQNGHIERPAAKVIHGNCLAVLLLVCTTARASPTVTCGRLCTRKVAGKWREQRREPPLTRANIRAGLRVAPPSEPGLVYICIYMFCIHVYACAHIGAAQ